MKVKKEQDGPVAFIKTDKSRIIEVTESNGNFSVVGTYVRIGIANIPMARFAPKQSAATKASQSLSDNDEDADPLTRGFRIPREDIEHVALLIEGGATTPINICKEVGISMPTFMSVFKRLKELGRVDANAQVRALGKVAESE